MKGICFKEHLFNLVTKGTKTQTRRVLNPQPIGETYSLGMQEDGTFKIGRATSHQYEYIRPRYQIGDKVYLKEPYAIRINDDVEPISYELVYQYRNYGEIIQPIGGWRNKLFMPESAARYWIEITNVTIERIQEISHHDCLLEGILPYSFPVGGLHTYTCYSNGIDTIQYRAATPAYHALIDKIDGKGTWDRNPVVFTYDFKLTTKP